MNKLLIIGHPHIYDVAQKNHWASHIIDDIILEYDINEITTVDMQPGGDIKADIFSNYFINSYIYSFDVVFMPDMRGLWEIYQFEGYSSDDLDELERLDPNNKLLKSGKKLDKEHLINILLKNYYRFDRSTYFNQIEKSVALNYLNEIRLLNVDDFDNFMFVKLKMLINKVKILGNVIILSRFWNKKFHQRLLEMRDFDNFPICGYINGKQFKHLGVIL